METTNTLNPYMITMESIYRRFNVEEEEEVEVDQKGQTVLQSDFLSTIVISEMQPYTTL